MVCESEPCERPAVILHAEHTNAQEAAFPQMSGPL